MCYATPHVHIRSLHVPLVEPLGAALATTGDNWRQELWSSSSRQLATTGDKNCGVVVVVVQAGGY